MLGKVEICGVNTTKLPTLTAAETDALLHRAKDGGDAVCVMDQVRDTKNTDEDWLEQIALKEAMARLSERERQILALRYSDGKTQMEVSSEIGISQAQVSRLEKNAIKSIKKNM